MPQAKSSTVTRRWSRGRPGNPDALFQDVVNRAHDQIHDGRRRVIDASCLFHLGVVFGEKILWVALEGAVLLLVLRPHLAAERLAVLERQVFVDFAEFESVHNGKNFLDDPADFDIFLRAEIVEKVHEFADKPKRTRHKLWRVGKRDHFAVGIQLGEERP